MSEEKVTNRSLVLLGHGGLDKLQLQNQPLPHPGSGEIRIKVAVCDVNFENLMARQGLCLYENNPKLPFVLGNAVSGIVDELGEGVKEPTIGTRVLALCNFGGWSTYAVTEADMVYAIPDSMSFEEAAAIPVNYITAYCLLFNFGNLREGQSVLCHMAAGGVGCAIGQLSRMVPNVTLYGTCSAEKHEYAKANGYTHLIDYRKQDYFKEIRELAPEGIDLVLDPLGGADSKKNYELTRTFGRQILYGTATAIHGENRKLMSFAKTWWNTTGKNPFDLMTDNKMVGGFHLRHVMGSFRKNFLPKAMEDLLRWYNEGIVKPKIDSLHPFEDYTVAFRKMHERKNIGKVLLSPNKTKEIITNGSTV